MDYILQREKTKIIIYKNDEVLFLEKKGRKKRFVLPGGFLKKNEDPIVCLLREVEEETDIHLKLKKIKRIETINGIGKNNKYLKKHYFKYKYENEEYENVETFKFKSIRFKNYKKALKHLNESDKIILKSFFKS
jgi:ADP-ribose pyrophosphatase YjhB (NUDIX family)